MLINPKDIVERELGLAPGMKVADFGCGSGHFTTEIAKQIGRDGMVYAFDVQEEALSAVKSRASAMDIDNIETARINLEIEKSTALTGGLVDLVIISNMLFQVENKEAVAREAFRILKLGGKVIVIEWDVSSALAGPPRGVSHIFSILGLDSKSIGSTIILGQGITSQNKSPPFSTNFRIVEP